MAPSKKETAWVRSRWPLLCVIPVLWCGAAQFGWLDFLEEKLTDWRFLLRGEIDAPMKIVYVDMDSQSLAEIGGQPWSRSYFARVADALVARAGVKAVGIDVLFSENGVPESIDRKKRIEGNRELARFLAKEPPVVVAASYAAAVDRGINGELIFRGVPRVGRGTPKSEPPELPTFRISEKDPRQQWSPALVGLIDTVEGGTRAVYAYAPSVGRSYFHLAIELARLHYGVAPDGIEVAGDHIDLRRPDGSRAARIPLREHQLLDVNWFSAWDSRRNPRIGFSTVFNYASMLDSKEVEERKTAEAFFGQEDFRDAIVLIGPVDPLQQDIATTPFDATPVPKVGVHGNLLKTILTGRYLRPLPTWGGVKGWDCGIVLALAVAVVALATASGRRGVASKLAAVALLAGYTGFTCWVFAAHDLVLPLAAPLGAAFTTSFAGVILQLVEEERQKSRIKGMFGTYLAPAVVEAMVESGQDPELGGHDAEITAYFSDIQSFSSFSEVLSSAKLTELLNEYLTACTDLVQAEGGSLDKYIGDAVVAMYGAPIAAVDHALRACVASQRVQKQIAALRAKWRGEGDTWPPLVHRLRTRIGLNTGVCMIGNMGSRTRFNYTMMGDNVNLAARMESGAKSYGVYTMVTEATKLACERDGGDRVVFRYLDRIVVKGRSQPVPVYEIVGLKEDVPADTREGLELYRRGIECYLERDWEGARAQFRASAVLEPNQPDPAEGVATNPSLVMLGRCAEMKVSPPGPGWDGVYVMKTK